MYRGGNGTIRVIPILLKKADEREVGTAHRPFQVATVGFPPPAPHGTVPSCQLSRVSRQPVNPSNPPGRNIYRDI